MPVELTYENTALWAKFTCITCAVLGGPLCTLTLNGPTREQSVHNIPICRQLGHWHWHSGTGLLRDNSNHQLHIILKWFSVTFGRLVAVPAWSWLAWRSHSLMRKLISLSISMNVHSKQNRCLKCSSRWTSWKSNYITKSLYQYIWSVIKVSGVSSSCIARFFAAFLLTLCYF